jgi:hypothetical protein
MALPVSSIDSFCSRYAPCSISSSLANATTGSSLGGGRSGLANAAALLLCSFVSVVIMVRTSGWQCEIMSTNVWQCEMMPTNVYTCKRRRSMVVVQIKNRQFGMIALVLNSRGLERVYVIFSNWTTGATC